MTIAVLLAARLKNDRAAADLLSSADFVVAADGGANHAARLGLSLDLLAGDFDSVDRDVLAAFEAAGTRIERVPAAKDETDAELAFRLALQEASRRNAKDVTLLVAGALGGRPDHEMGTLLHLARLADSGPRILLTDGETLICLLAGPASLRVSWPPHGKDKSHEDRPQGWYVSSIALRDDVTGLSYAGLVYPLTDFTLPFGSTRGVSNETPDPEDVRFTVSLRSGLLAVIVTPRESAAP